MVWMANPTPRPLLQEKVQRLNVQEAEWAPGTLWVGIEKRKLCFPLQVFESRTFQRVASRYAITSFICCLLFVERSEQCPVAFVSKGEYVSDLTRFIRACREKADIMHKRNEMFNSKPHAKSGISHYSFLTWISTYLNWKRKAIRGALDEATNGLIVWGIYVHKSKRN